MPRLLTLSGSVRSGSTNAAVLRTVAAVAPDGVTVTPFDGLGALPHFDPDLDTDPLPGPVAELRAAIAAADALLVCTPEYAGALPGSFKNLLDWTVGGDEIGGTPAGWVNASTAPAGAAGAHAELRTVLGYTGAVLVEDACASVPVRRDAITDGVVTDPAVRDRLRAVVLALVSG